MVGLYLAWLISNRCPSRSLKKARSSHADSAGESGTEPRAGEGPASTAAACAGGGPLAPTAG